MERCLLLMYRYHGSQSSQPTEAPNQIQNCCETSFESGYKRKFLGTHPLASSWSVPLARCGQIWVEFRLPGNLFSLVPLLLLLLLLLLLSSVFVGCLQKAVSSLG